MEQTAVRPFSNMQWYLAKSSNVVHFICASPHDVSKDEFERIIGDVTALAPQLLWEESLTAGGYRETGPAAQKPMTEYQRLPRQDRKLADFDAFLTETLADTGTPASRALCIAAPQPDDNGVCSWLVITAMHSIIEGNDISDLVRGRSPGNPDRPLAQARLGILQRVGLRLMVPSVALLVTFSAWFRRARPTGYRFLRLAIDRRKVGQAARTLGVTQRALLFGLVLYGGKRDREGKRRVFVGYPSVSRERAVDYNDDVLSAQVDDFRYHGGEDLAEYVRGLDKILASRKEKSLFVQAFIGRLVGLQRRIYNRVPWFIPEQLFDSAYYGILLSLVTPIRCARLSPSLAGSTGFAGSMAGVCPACSFIVSERTITVNIWADEEIIDRFDEIIAAAQALGLDPKDWR